MHLIRTLFAMLIPLTALVSCGRPTVLAESTPRPGDAPMLETVPPPAGSVKVPVPKTTWMPVSIGTGQGKDLVQGLLDRESIAIILPTNAPALLEDRVFQMVKVSSPGTKVVARGRATLDALLEERGEVPYRVTLEPGGVDMLGRPYYLPKEHPLSTDWLARKKPLKGADAILTVRRVNVDDRRLRQLRKGRIGSCEAYEKGLDDVSSEGAKYFKSYSDFVNGALENAFSRHLKSALPFWQEELGSWNDPEASRCRGVYEEFLGKYKPCISGICDVGPVFFGSEGGIIGMVDSALTIPKTCPTEGMRDYVAEMEDLARRAVSEVLPSIDSGWTTELMRSGAFEETKQGVSQTCAPRRRRIDQVEMGMARADVNEFLSDLSSRDLSGEWIQSRGNERAAGVGPVRVLAKVRALGYDPTSSAQELFERLRDLDKCDEGKERFYQATLVDVGTSEVVFMGIFFEEELLCDGLPPASPSF